MQIVTPKRLYLVRHTETVANQTGRFTGVTDSDLTDRGQAQVQATAAHFADLGICSVYSSPLGRAKIMADAISTKCVAPVYYLPELQERAFGLWEGLTFAEAESVNLNMMQKWMADPILASPPEGESLAQLMERITPIAQWLTATSTAHPTQRLAQPGLAMPDGPLVLVSHAAALRALLVKTMNLPPVTMLRIDLDKASITILDLFGPDQMVLRTLNNCSHLGNI